LVVRRPGVTGLGAAAGLIRMNFEGANRRVGRTTQPHSEGCTSPARPPARESVAHPEPHGVATSVADLSEHLGQ
jgi:hypothetical protein